MPPLLLVIDPEDTVLIGFGMQQLEASPQTPLRQDAARTINTVEDSPLLHAGSPPDNRRHPSASPRRHYPPCQSPDTHTRRHQRASPGMSARRWLSMLMALAGLLGAGALGRGLLFGTAQGPSPTDGILRLRFLR